MATTDDLPVTQTMRYTSADLENEDTLTSPNLPGSSCRVGDF
jgi:hypothetical protein